MHLLLGKNRENWSERERDRERQRQRERHTQTETHRERVITVKKTTYLNEKYFPLKRKRYHYKEL